jgi:predicted ATPase
MKVKIENLGILKKAEFDVGDLTIICGRNNTGKTYATYALYGFLSYWNEAFSADLFSKEMVEELFNSGSIKVDLDSIYKRTKEIISDACAGFIQSLPSVFAASNKYFKGVEFEVSIESIDVKSIEKTKRVLTLSRKHIYDLIKEQGKNYVTIVFAAKTEEIANVNGEWLLRQMNSDLLETIFGNILVEPFIASIERTGAAIFRKELDFSRNRLLEHISNKDKDIDPFSLVSSYYNGGYGWPVKDDVDFIRNLEEVMKYESIISENNPDIISLFNALLGGEYKSAKEGFFYIPHKSNVKLTMGESASSVRSLINVGIYIKHLAKPGDFLMIDEPELNLHPYNQRLMARVLARLVNVGVRVFITTHSDYILKEFNTLIMLKNAGSKAFSVMQKYDYQESELLDSRKIKAYIAKIAPIEVAESTRRQKHNTFIVADIDKFGIEIADFDETINSMNAIQDELLYGGYIE